MSLPRRLVLALALASPLVWGEERTPLSAIPYDNLHLTNGDSLKGSIVERLTSGAVRFAPLGRPATVVEKGLIIRIEERQNMAQAVARRARQALMADDAADLLRTLRFAADYQDPPPRTLKIGEVASSTAAEVRNAATEAAALALDRKPTVDIAAATIALHRLRKDQTGIAAAAERGLVADPNWTSGYEILVEIHQARDDRPRLKDLITRWLERQPTASLANRHRAALAEQDGDLRAAFDSHRKGWDLHQDPAAGIGAVRTALRRADTVEALRLAKAVQGSAKAGADGDAWLGIALAATGDDAGAGPRLATAAQTVKDAATLEAVRWNLGVLALRQRQDTVAQQWFQLTSLAPVAEALLARRPLPDDRPKTLDAYAKGHGVAIDLENRRFAPALRALDGDDSPRATVLTQIAQVLRTQGAPESVSALTSTSGAESLRWQAYGHLLAGRDREAEALLKTLPDDDGWALSCRIYLAASRKDDTGARALLERLPRAQGVPTAYAERLSTEFASSQDEIVVDGFDADGQPLGEIWRAALSGNVTTTQIAGSLRIEGAGSDQTSSVLREVPAARLRLVETDITAISAAAGGLLLTDMTGKQGLHLALTGQGPAWRSMTAGTWGAWTPLTGDGGTTLGVSIDRGRITLQVGRATPHEVSAPLGGGASLLVGLGVLPDSTAAFDAAFGSLRIQLRPAAGTGK